MSIRPRNALAIAAGAASALALVAVLRLIGPAPARPAPPDDDVLLPAIRDLEPSAGAVVRGDRAWARWSTNQPARGLVRWRKKGERDFREVEAVPGEFLLAELAPLEPGASYEFEAVCRGRGGEVRSDLRTFESRGGLAFEPPEVSAEVDRDYDRTVEVTLHNTSREPLRIAARALRSWKDLQADFVGAGSADRPLELAPDARATLRLAVTAVDAAQPAYDIPIEAGAAYATVRLRVRNPPLRLSCRVVATDPFTLAQRLRIVNEGAPVGDLRIRVAPPDDADVRLQPGTNHAFLPSGGSLEIVASPVLFLEFTGLKTSLQCLSGGQTLAFPLEFRVPPGARLMGVRTSCSTGSECNDWYCTNKPDTCSEMPAPPGSGPETGPEGGSEASKEDGENIVKAAQKWLEKAGELKYDKTGNDRKGPKNFDCSGFAETVVEEAGLPDPGLGGGGMGGCQNIVDALGGSMHPESEAQPGDIITFDYKGWRIASTDSSGNITWDTFPVLDDKGEVKKDADGKDVTSDERVQDVKADHCGIVSEVADGHVTKVIHMSLSGLKEQAIKDAWTGYYKQKEKLPGTQYTLYDVWDPQKKVFRPKKPPSEGQCDAEKGCHDGEGDK